MAITPTDFRGLIDTLARARVEFILVGGVAATLHGSARATLGLDVVYRRLPENVNRLVNALAPLRSKRSAIAVRQAVAEYGASIRRSSPHLHPAQEQAYSPLQRAKEPPWTRPAPKCCRARST